MVKGDLTTQYTDAIVNPANSNLEHKGGAAKQIANAAGPEFEEECKAFLEEKQELK